MRTNTRRCLVTALPVSLFIGLAAPQALASYNSLTRVNVPDGICSYSGAERTAFLCDITDGGTVIEAVTGSDGSFPQMNGSRSYFIYRVTDNGLGASPSHFDMELPICRVEYGQPDLVALFSKDLSGPGGAEISDVDESSGVSFPGAMLLKLDAPVPSRGSRTYTAVFNSSSISAEPIQFAFKTGDGVEYGAKGILGAGCGLVDQRTTKSCKSQTMVGSGASATYQSTFVSKIINKGHAALYEPRIQEHNTHFDCQITSVNGLAVVPAIPIPTQNGSYVRIPINARFDGILDPIVPGSGRTSGESVTVGIACTHDEPDLVNELNSKVETQSGFVVMRTAVSNMERQCPLKRDFEIAIDKTCGGESPGERLTAMNGHLVVEVCPRIRVTNKGLNRLHDVTVTDNQVDALKAGLNIGSLEPNQTVDLGDDLGVDTCYLPSAPNQPAVGDNATPSNPSDDKYFPATATFTNSATVTADGGAGTRVSDSDSATCSLVDKCVRDQN